MDPIGLRKYASKPVLIGLILIAPTLVSFPLNEICFLIKPKFAGIFLCSVQLSDCNLYAARFSFLLNVCLFCTDNVKIFFHHLVKYLTILN